MFRTIMFWLLLGTACWTSRVSQAHEGHQPLPTKGVQLDLAHGVIVLSREAKEILDLQTAEVQVRDIHREFPASADLVAPWDRRALVTTRLAGRIVKVNVRPGDAVRAGQTLAELESVELQTLLFDFQRSKSEEQLATRLIGSAEAAAKSGAVPAQRVVEARSTLRQAQNSLVLLRSQARLLNLSDADLGGSDQVASGRKLLPILAPIDGRVMHTDLSVGQVVEPNMHLAEILDTRLVWARISILERDLHRAREGQGVRLTLNGVTTATDSKTLEKLSLQLDPKTRQAWGWLTLKNPELTSATFLPGMSGQAWLKAPGKPQALSVPAAAVLSDGAERYVLVEQTSTRDSGEYLKKAVVVGRRTSDDFELLAGDVFPGDRVVTQGSHELASLFVLGVLKLSPETARNIGLDVKPVGRHIVDEVLTVAGHLDIPPQRRTVASAPVSGTIRRVLVKRSQPVVAGEILGEVASLQFQDLQLALLRADLDRQLWEETAARLSAAGQAIPRRQLWEAESKLETANIELKSSRAKLQALGIKPADLDRILASRELLSALPVRSPIKGTVVDFDGTLGQVIRADETLFEVHDTTEILVQAFVPERHAGRIRTGQRARVRLVGFPEAEAEATVRRRADSVSPETRRLDVWLEFAKKPEPGWMHGLSARVTISLDQPSPVLAVPSTAIVRDGLRAFVFVRLSDRSFERRRVETGRSDDRFVEILRGVREKDQIAVKGVASLQTAYATLR